MAEQSRAALPQVRMTKRVSGRYWRLKGLYGYHRTAAHGDARWMSGFRDAGGPSETGGRREAVGRRAQGGEVGGRQEQRGGSAGTRTGVLPKEAQLGSWPQSTNTPASSLLTRSPPRWSRSTLRFKSHGLCAPCRRASLLPSTLFLTSRQWEEARTA